MRGRSMTRWGAGLAVAALALSACGGGGEEDEPASGESAAAEGATGAITYAGCKPQNPLIPSNTQETCGGDIVEALFTGLVRYNADDASSVNEVAESIESEDNQTFTIKLKPDWTFHDGTKVTAQDFVDTWNYASWPGNAQLNAYFFEDIEGFSYGEDADGDGTVSTEEAAGVPKELSGLKVVDETTFTVKLNSVYSTWPARLGYSAFVPLPKAFFADPEAFGAEPIGNGPFQLVSNDPDTSVKVTAYEDYKGSDAPKVKDIDFKVYVSEDAAYADLLADNVDFQQQLPSAALAGRQFETDLGEGRFISKPVGVFSSMTFASGDPKFTKPEIRKAISMAIDREAVIQVAFDGLRTPADGFVPPIVDGYKEDLCGEACTFDAAKAKELYDAAGGIQGGIVIQYNGDGPHKEWVDAACTSITNALGVECQGKAFVDFATLRTEVTERTIKDIFRTGWQMDYPSIENFMIPLYQTGAGSNDGDYSNPEVDALFKEAKTLSAEEAAVKYQEASAILAEDLPVVPLWYTEAQAGWSSKVDNVKLTPFGTLDYSSITVAS